MISFPYLLEMWEAGRTRNTASVCTFQRLVIIHVRYINILTWLWGFQVKLLYLVLFSLYPSLFWELRDKRKWKKLQFWPESLGAMLEYWYIELKRGLLQKKEKLWELRQLSVEHILRKREEITRVTQRRVQFTNFQKPLPGNVGNVEWRAGFAIWAIFLNRRNCPSQFCIKTYWWGYGTNKN